MMALLITWFLRRQQRRRQWQGAVYLRDLRVLRKKGRRNHIDLTLPEPCTYHLFLSHVWATGQQPVTLLKEALHRMLPPRRDGRASLAVFQDVDNLDDLAKSEGLEFQATIWLAIERSAMVLLFLSRDYFLSANCVREARRAIELGKPLVLVHVPEGRTTGGTALSVHREQCPEDMRGPIFDAGWPLVLFHNLAHFRDVTYQCVIEHMLTALPRYRARPCPLALRWPSPASRASAPSLAARCSRRGDLATLRSSLAASPAHSRLARGDRSHGRVTSWPRASSRAVTDRTGARRRRSWPRAATSRRRCIFYRRRCACTPAATTATARTWRARWRCCSTRSRSSPMTTSRRPRCADGLVSAREQRAACGMRVLTAALPPSHASAQCSAPSPRMQVLTAARLPSQVRMLLGVRSHRRRGSSSSNLVAGLLRTLELERRGSEEPMATRCAAARPDGAHDGASIRMPSTESACGGPLMQGGVAGVGAGVASAAGGAHAGTSSAEGPSDRSVRAEPSCDSSARGERRPWREPRRAATDDASPVAALAGAAATPAGAAPGAAPVLTAATKPAGASGASSANGRLRSSRRSHAVLLPRLSMRTSRLSSRDAKALPPLTFVLLLNDETFVGAEGDALAFELKHAIVNGATILLVHEGRAEMGACEFDRFLVRCPRELERLGLFKRIAIPFLGPPFDRISAALLVRRLGAKTGPRSSQTQLPLRSRRTRSSALVSSSTSSRSAEGVIGPSQLSGQHDSSIGSPSALGRSFGSSRWLLPLSSSPVRSSQYSTLHERYDEMNNGATAIQATQRGFMARAAMAAVKRAVMRIQAGIRALKVRGAMQKSSDHKSQRVSHGSSAKWLGAGGGSSSANRQGGGDGAGTIAGRGGAGAARQTVAIVSPAHDGTPGAELPSTAMASGSARSVSPSAGHVSPRAPAVSCAVTPKETASGAAAEADSGADTDEQDTERIESEISRGLLSGLATPKGAAMPEGMPADSSPRPSGALWRPSGVGKAAHRDLLRQILLRVPDGENVDAEASFRRARSALETRAARPVQPGAPEPRPAPAKGSDSPGRRRAESAPREYTANPAIASALPTVAPICEVSTSDTAFSTTEISVTL